jgi:ubiquinone/menaquinone biosynthesis C-methylase UbiE
LIANPFDQRIDHYDAWFDTPAGSAIFATELAAIQPLMRDLPRPWLEVGVGTGRFASALSVDVGIDIARGAVGRARQRNVRGAVAAAELLPFPDCGQGAVLFAVTLCFVADPAAALSEARRVLKPGGAVVLGIIPAESDWGRHYQRRASAGHSSYRHARFFSRRELRELLAHARLVPQRTRSALFWSPDADPGLLDAVDGDIPQASFLATLAVPAETTLVQTL